MAASATSQRRQKRISSKNMTSSSTSNTYNIIDVDSIIDLDNIIDVDEDVIFPISNQKYAQEMQLQEAIMSSILSIPETSTPDKLKRKQQKATQLPESFCGICMDTKAQSEMFSNATVCTHLFCSDCIREHVSVKIKENIANVKCPDPTCKGLIGPEICRSIVPKEVLERWEDALCESLILGAHKFYCPFKDCSAMLVDDGREAVTMSECPNCNRLFCAQCKVAWHSGMDCREFKSLKEDERNPEDIMVMQLAKNNKWKRCPNCNFYVERRDGCLHISCRCGYEFCYGCGEKYNRFHACNPLTYVNVAPYSINLYVLTL